MKEITFNGLTGYSYGHNQNVFGMELVQFESELYSVDNILETEGVYLHPTVEPQDGTIYALIGTNEQYSKLYDLCAEQYAIRNTPMYDITIDEDDEYPIEEVVRIHREYREALANKKDEFEPWFKRNFIKEFDVLNREKMQELWDSLEHKNQGIVDTNVTDEDLKW